MRHIEPGNNGTEVKPRCPRANEQRRIDRRLKQRELSLHTLDVLAVSNLEETILDRIPVGEELRVRWQAKCPPTGSWGSRICACSPREVRESEVPKEIIIVHSKVLDLDRPALAGIEELSIGDTLCESEHPEPLPAIQVDEPTISMVFSVNDSPFAGKEGKFVTSRHVLARLERAAMRDAALTIAPTASADSYEVMGRGVMHLSVLMENMRREGYEFAVSKPRVIIKEVDGVRCEPVERATIEVPADAAGKIIEYLGRRRGVLENMENDGDLATIEMFIPSRGLIGARTALLTLSQGEAVLSHVFERWEPDAGEIAGRQNGVLISDRNGAVVPYALDGLQDRGTFFTEPGTEVYTGMIVGQNNREHDLEVNLCRQKKLTNMRAAGRDDNTKIAPAKIMSLEEQLEFIETDERLEITPESLRPRKTLLDPNARKKQLKAAKG